MAIALFIVIYLLLAQTVVIFYLLPWPLALVVLCVECYFASLGQCDSSVEE